MNVPKVITLIIISFQAYLFFTARKELRWSMLKYFIPFVWKRYNLKNLFAEIMRSGSLATAIALSVLFFSENDGSLSPEVFLWCKPFLYSMGVVWYIMITDFLAESYLFIGSLY